MEKSISSVLGDLPLNTSAFITRLIKKEYKSIGQKRSCSTLSYSTNTGNYTVKY